jgi:hypothetical protein
MMVRCILRAPFDSTVERHNLDQHIRPLSTTDHARLIDQVVQEFHLPFEQRYDGGQLKRRLDDILATKWYIRNEGRKLQAAADLTPSALGDMKALRDTIQKVQ